MMILQSYSMENNDIYDSDIDLDYFEQFKDILREINSIIVPKFRIWDKKALDYQKYSRNLMLGMILTGLIAIIIVIPEINNVLPDTWGVIIQNVAAFFILVSILIGIWFNFQKKWLLYRHKSELLRLLKFHTLLDPATFSLQREIPLEKLRRCVHDAEKIDQQNIIEFTKDEFAFWEYDRFSSHQIDNENFLNLIRYYQEKRITSQIDYFDKRAKNRETIDYYTKYIHKSANFFGVLFICLFFLLGMFFSKDLSANLSFLVVIAAILPALGSSIKSYRDTNEISRISSIYRTRQNKLSTINKSLTDGLEQETMDMYKELELIQQCENMLKDEHQEWLRLMIQSEWVT